MDIGNDFVFIFFCDVKFFYDGTGNTCMLIFCNFSSVTHKFSHLGHGMCRGANWQGKRWPVLRGMRTLQAGGLIDRLCNTVDIRCLIDCLCCTDKAPDLIQ